MRILGKVIHELLCLAWYETTSLIDPCTIVCSISNLKQTTQIFRHRVKMGRLENCDHHVLAPDTVQINFLFLITQNSSGFFFSFFFFLDFLFCLNTKGQLLKDTLDGV